MTARDRSTCGDVRKEFYEQVWDILVEHAGANKGSNDKELFVFAFTKDSSPIEYRFSGLLGFGGKFWHYDMSPYASTPFYVTYYPEDHNPKREKISEKVNTLITALWNAECRGSK